MATLSGKVLVDGEEAALDAVVELHNSGGDIVDQVQVDDTGRYMFHLSEGVWSLRSWDPHGGRAEGRASLGLDEDVTLDLRLESFSTT
jgi:hypothetical protein